MDMFLWCFFSVIEIDLYKFFYYKVTLLRCNVDENVEMQKVHVFSGKLIHIKLLVYMFSYLEPMLH